MSNEGWPKIAETARKRGSLLANSGRTPLSPLILTALRKSVLRGSKINKPVNWVALRPGNEQP